MFIKDSIRKVINDKRMLNQNALHQFATLKPGTIRAAHFTISILITRRNIPNVKIVIGIVSIISTGFTKALRDDGRNN